MSTPNDPGSDPTPPPSDEPGHHHGDETPLAEQLGGFISPGRHNVLLIYILYLLGAVPFAGAVPAIIGFVMAVLNREDAGPLERSHYEYQVRQGLMGLAFLIVSSVLTLLLIGFLGLLATLIWWIVRSVKGLIAINHHEPIADPKTWLW
ncbi:DUF4870 family protein [Bauldia sp.]|uniref:DUF4870 family protein n=1 Tax=Bauldia sp. TaxID=2575872 RepID=UPI003BACFA5A